MKFRNKSLRVFASDSRKQKEHWTRIPLFLLYDQQLYNFGQFIEMLLSLVSSGIEVNISIRVLGVKEQEIALITLSKRGLFEKYWVAQRTYGGLRTWLVKGRKQSRTRFYAAVNLLNRGGI